MSLERTQKIRNAEKLVRDGQLQPALEEYLCVLDEDPRDATAANAVGDLYLRLGRNDEAIDQFLQLADRLHDDGFLPKATAICKKILKLKPTHEKALVRISLVLSDQGLFADARNYLTTVGEERRKKGDQRGAIEARILIGNLDPADFGRRRSAVAARLEIADVAGAVQDLKAIAADLLEKDRQAEAIEVLREASGLAPNDAEVRARFTALTAPPPEAPPAAPETVEAETAPPVEAASPLETSAPVDALPPTEETLQIAEPPVQDPPAVAADSRSDANAAEPELEPEPEPEPEPEAEAEAEAEEEPGLAAHASPHAIDLDELLAVIEGSDPESEPEPAPPAPIASDNLDDVFAQMRSEATARLADDAGEVEYKRALVLRDAGDLDGCIEALERASRLPTVRFATAAMLGRLLKERGETGKALEWFEQAAQADAPNPDDYHEVLYELATGLEASGETARALAVCLELQTDAGPYRDVGARVDRLARIQAEG